MFSEHTFGLIPGDKCISWSVPILSVKKGRDLPCMTVHDMHLLPQSRPCVGLGRQIRPVLEKLTEVE